MGQYYFICNVDKKEFLDPFKLGSGMKAWEQLANDIPSKALLVLVLSSPENRGGGDLEESPIIGRWAGDRIIMVGDYAEAGDHPTIRTEDIFDYCSECTEREEGEEAWTDVSDLVAPVLVKELGYELKPSGWNGYNDWVKP